MRAVVLGGTGGIGTATATRLVRAGWDVTVLARDVARVPPVLAGLGVAVRAGDRTDSADLAAALGDGADLVVDCACYDAAGAELLLPHLAGVGATVMVSSKAVYVDAEGRHSNSDDPPRHDGPVGEGTPTLPPSRTLPYASREGYGPCKVAAEQVLLGSGHPVTVLRPSKVHGAWSRQPRLAPWVDAALAGAGEVSLPDRGGRVDQTSAAVNVAALVETVATLDGTRVLNAADPDAPSALEISRAVARHLGHQRREVLLPGDPPPPVVLDTSAALALGHVPVGDFAATCVAEIDWLVSRADDG